MWRKHRGLAIYPLPPGLHRRAWAGFQMGFLVVVLWPLFTPPVTTVAGFAFMLPALIGFFVDWLIVSGRIDRESEYADRFFGRLTFISQTTGQPVLRIAIVAMLAMAIGQTGWPAVSGHEADSQGLLWVGGSAIASVLILLGVAGRSACLLLIALLGWRYSGQSLAGVEVALLCSVVWLMLLGTGRFSLWQGDDDWINRHDGE